MFENVGTRSQIVFGFQNLPGVSYSKLLTKVHGGRSVKKDAIRVEKQECFAEF